MLTKTEAIVLKSMKYGDTSKIVTFYTRQFGKLKGIAKGARKLNNKFGSALEPFSRVVLVVYKKDNRDLHLISQCDALEAYRKIHDHFDRISAGLAVLELVDQLTHGEEENPEMYALLTRTLGVLNDAERNFPSIRRAFQLKCAILFGFAPSLNVCSECGRSLVSGEPLSAVGFQLTDGAIICSTCKKTMKPGNTYAEITLSAPAFRILQQFADSSVELMTAITYHENVGNELDDALRLYFRYHFDHARELKSVKLSKSIHQT